MPKIIENLRARLLQEARKQVDQNGYGAMTIRSVAAACGVGVGTVYNYFPSKDMLIASFMLEDWNICMSAVRECAASADRPAPVLRCIFDQLHIFIHQHRSLFQDESAAHSFALSSTQRHSMLRQQIAQPLTKFYDDPFVPEFVAEAILTWTVEDREFDQILQVLVKL